MNRLECLVLGTLLGGAVVWLFGDDIRRTIDRRTQGVRTRAADTLAAAASGLETARERIESGLTGGPQHQ
jgi:membrane protein YqaA with SNARE-associated domain